MVTVSVIVPVYNVEKYLHRCVDSILAQTFTDFELILVDDGSPDHCGAICDEYARKDARVRVIHQKNAGVSAARNRGIREAAGEFVGFVDADDWILPEMYENMILDALSNQADIVMCDAMTVYSDGKEEIDTITQLPANTVLDHDSLKPGIMLEFAGAVWRCLYRSRLLKEKRVVFPTGLKLSEDRVFNIYAMGYARRIIYLKTEYYMRFVNTESAVNSFHKDYFQVAKLAKEHTRRAIELAWENKEEYQIAYLQQYVQAAIQAVDNLKHENSIYPWPMRIKKVKEICADLELRNAILTYGYGGIKGKWIAENRAVLLSLRNDKWYWLVLHARSIYIEYGLVGLLKKSARKIIK